MRGSPGIAADGRTIHSARRAMPITENFDQAELRLVRFLESRNLPGDLDWICREDITAYRRLCYVHPAPPEENRELYRRHYEAGLKRGLGVCLEVACFSEGFACCHVWFPRGEAEADALMMSDGIRLRVAQDDEGGGFAARRSFTERHFHLRRALFRLLGEPAFVRGIPRRGELANG